MVYYLRTINRDYRQPWLDAIYESIRVYRDSAQTAQGGGYYGTALLPQPSVPSVDSTIPIILRMYHSFVSI